MKNNDIVFIQKSKFNVLLFFSISLLIILFAVIIFHFLSVNGLKNNITCLNIELKEKNAEIQSIKGTVSSEKKYDDLEMTCIKSNYETRLSFYENRIVIISPLDDQYYHHSNCSDIGFESEVYSNGQLSIPPSSLLKNTPYYTSDNFIFYSITQATDSGHKPCPKCCN